jgi:hypothetical protein
VSRSNLDLFVTLDAVLPAQFFNPLWRARCSGERRLLVAVLEDALHLALGGPQLYNGKEWSDLVTWVEIKGPGDGYRFSLDDICYHLDIAPAGLRRAMLRIIEGHEKRQLDQTREGAKREVEGRAKVDVA